MWILTFSTQAEIPFTQAERFRKEFISKIYEPKHIRRLQKLTCWITCSVKDWRSSNAWQKLYALVQSCHLHCSAQAQNHWRTTSIGKIYTEGSSEPAAMKHLNIEHLWLKCKSEICKKMKNLGVLVIITTNTVGNRILNIRTDKQRK
jgi:hypothetical protein